ncbi:hypothetical protein [Roseisolibacter sp. H3M3-2]|uniref:hypothetical protein n=1 Tax=Roseisolibacter sp. H3M3-2 TaxID=3031323 RepID=UPI0023DB0FA5|nr:hypothetical protein [Roseisolibacter sp. H3M3-2]MDF1505338.1 hypothetical protein [Roseisolibacter sp. H3M3-2]
MPADYTIDPARRRIHTRLSGTLTDPELIAMEARLRVDPAYDAEYDHVIDATGVTALAVTGAGIRHIVTVTPNGQGCAGRRVIVAPTDALYGMGRMFQTLRDAEPSELAVVRTREQAEALLAAPADEAPRRSPA